LRLEEHQRVLSRLGVRLVPGVTRTIADYSGSTIQLDLALKLACKQHILQRLLYAAIITNFKRLSNNLKENTSFMQSILQDKGLNYINLFNGCANTVIFQ
jgi:hypothetical protein